MKPSRNVDDARRLDLHWGAPHPPGDEHISLSRAGRASIDFPPLEYVVQQTERAVYVLARGLGESLTESSAAAAVKWFTCNKFLKIDRDGPSRFPGPDGTQYEWFFRVSGVEDRPPTTVETLFADVVARLRPPVPPPSVTTEHPDLDFLALEQVRASTYLVEQLRTLQRTSAAELRTRLLEQQTLSRNLKASSTNERAAVEGLLAEAIKRDEGVTLREEQLAEKERRLAAQEQWLTTELEKARRRSSGATREIDQTAVQRLFPRLSLDRDTVAVLDIELTDNSPYLRLLAALQDGVPMNPDAYPPCKKHVRLEEVPGNSWWEIRLRDNLASDYRLFYRPLDEERLEVHIVFRRDAQRFMNSLR